MNTNQTWIDEFKIFVINKNIGNMIKYIKKVPNFNSIYESQTALALINKAKELIIDEQKRIGCEMTQNRQTKKYLS